ncbi:hypothetical protein G5714_002652 [Onychostoma macrolepis]|uniref:MADF domain-containing protein n=1 Tax=Onychostoma macrolepis TaxID=369639 RepID=A0A7J6D7B9_9TELE|nr:hypothetical protein G5714_002652 [Onychostoma macrolepis]
MSIATALGISEAEVKKKMDSMRTQYSRYLKPPPSGSGGHHTPRQEWFLRRLKFLELHMKKRPSTSNLDVQNDSTSSLEEVESEDRGDDKEQEKEEEEQEMEEEQEEKLHKKINAAGNGYERSPEEVRNKWRDFASVTKRRAAAQRREAKKTGGGINSVPTLNAEEEKVLVILGPEALEGILGGTDACALTRPLPSKLSPPTSGLLQSGPSTSGLLQSGPSTSGLLQSGPTTSGLLQSGPPTSAMRPGPGLLLPSPDSPQSEASSSAEEHPPDISEHQPSISRQRRNRGRCGCSEKLLQSEKKKITELQSIRRELIALREQQDRHHQEVMAYRRAKLELLQQQASKPSLTMFLPTDNLQM